MCGGSEPAAPDPYATADAQYKYNSQAATDTARINAVDQYGPYGSTTFQRNADGTPASQTVTLSPQVQQWLDSQFGASTKLQDATSRQLDYLPSDKFQLPTGSADEYSRQAFGDAVLDPSNFDTSQIAAASYEQAKAQFQPDLDAARKAKGIELANRGINPGDEIYNDEMDRIDRQANTAYSSAARQAGLDAGNEQTRAVNNAVTARNYGSNTYQTGLANQLLERNQPFSEAAALMGTTPQFQTPSYMNTSAVNVASPDYQGTVNANYAQASKNAQANNPWNTIGSIGAGLAGNTALFCDEDLKEEREPADGEAILMSFRKMPVENWEYTDEAQEGLGLPPGRRTGPMAQEYGEAMGEDPEAKTIDIGDAIGKLMAAMRGLEERTHHLRPQEAA
jgi:hypothetical protein